MPCPWEYAQGISGLARLRLMNKIGHAECPEWWNLVNLHVVDLSFSGEKKCYPESVLRLCGTHNAIDARNG